MAEKISGNAGQNLEPIVPIRRIYRRLSAETIDELVQAYRHGASTTELRRRYELSQGGVIKILHSHRVEMRGRGMTDDDLAAAAELYRRAATLAQLGERFSLSPNAMRRALTSAGVIMRPRGGRKPRSLLSCFGSRSS